jgi:membrane-bound lytic murein transglycosylase A
MKIYHLVLTITVTVVFSLGMQFAYSSSTNGQVHYNTPTKLATESFEFSDDLDFENIELAIKRQMSAFHSETSKYDMNSTIQFGADTYTLKHMLETLTSFKAVATTYKECLKTIVKSECLKDLNTILKMKFNIYMPKLDSTDPRNGDTKPALFTSYYSPDLYGKFIKDSVYKNAIYRKPADPILRKKTRVEITFDDALKDNDLEIVYVKDSLYDIYLFHIEGGGRVQVKQNDGSYKSYYLSYDGSNKRSFNYIHRYMQAQGYLGTDRSVRAQRKFLTENPEKQREIYSSCDSFVYFKITTHEPHGIDSIPLTEKRTMAMDRKIYKASGILGFVKSRLPIRNTNTRDVDSKEYSRFFIHQDTGGGIKGKARADLYAGFGKEAEFFANHSKYQGEIYFLMLKK